MSLRRVLAPVLAVVSGVLVALPAGALAPARAMDQVPAPLTVDLPPLPDGATIGRVELDAGLVYVRALTPSQVPTARILRTASDGSGTWTPMLDPSTGDVLAAPTLELVTGALMVRDGQAASCADYRILGTAPGSTLDRRVTSCGAPQLGTGGETVAVASDRGVWSIQRLVDGSAWPGRLPDFVDGRRPTVEGHVAWFALAEPGLYGVDLDIGVAKYRALPDICARAFLDAPIVDGFARPLCGDTRVLAEPTRSAAPRPFPLYTSSLGGGIAVTHRYQATDPSGVASYDVSRRVASPGRPWTASTVPAAWRATTARSVSQRFAPGTNVCFNFRARDRAGNLSQIRGNAHEVCTAVPYDDRSFARSAGARAMSGPGIGRTLTELRGSAALVRRVTARELRVRVYGSGCVTATFGGHVYNRDGCVGGDASGGAHWIAVRFPGARTGTVKIQSLSGDPIRVDAVAALR